MIILNHGVLQLLVTTCALVAVAYAKNSTEWTNEITTSTSKNKTNFENSTVEIKKDKPIAEIVRRSHRRSPRFEAAASVPRVRVYNRPPGAKSESYYNYYETRGNTSAHTSGEAWSSIAEDFSRDISTPIEKNDPKVKDILRVKPKPNPTALNEASKIRSTTPAAPTSKSTPPPPTKISDQTVEPTSAKNNNENKGYIVWSSNDGGPNSRWILDDSSSGREKTPETLVEETMPKDGSHWKVVGDGGEGGWEVVDDKGEVEWKIEYDDGEWRVTSTGDIPEDAEWADPEYIYNLQGGPAYQEDEYNSWPADDYRVPSSRQFPERFPGGLSNGSLIKKDNTDQEQKDEASRTSDSATGWKTNESHNPSPINTEEKLPFGVRRKAPTNQLTSSSAEEKADSEISEEIIDGAELIDKPQNDQVITTGKSWVQGSPINKDGPKWVQSYGTKIWKGDNSGWNAGVDGQTWVTASKNYDLDPWLPKIPGAKNVPQKTPMEDNNSSKQDTSVRAWGTGYGSKTWKGNEWNSNVVWKTGFNSGLPWATDNSTWEFPDQKEEKKKPQVWSQPIPSNKEPIIPKQKTPPPSKRQDGIRIKWPTKSTNTGSVTNKSPPSRRTESDSYDDNDNSMGNIIWMQPESDTSTAEVGQSKPSDLSDGWQSGGWKVSTPQEWKPTVLPWKSKVPQKNSNLISVTWKAGGDNPVDYAPGPWNKGDWPDESGDPTWIFKGCKMTLKCGSNGDNDQSNPSDTSEDDTMPTTTPTPMSIPKGWPPRPNLGKSWKPPPKSWKPPTKWIKPTPEPTTPENMNPTTTWETSPPQTIKWNKPTPPPDMWKFPPSTILYTETTPALPNVSWKPPPPPIKWKKGPKPTKSWRPRPTKSWKPPKQPTKTWQPSIATPQPDMWPTTKPDCKETSDATQPPQLPTEDDTVDPPQIIIITKLPKGSYPKASDKKDNKGDAKRKPPFGPWMFPPRKNIPKGSKNRRDRKPPTGNYKGQPKIPTRNNFQPPNKMKGWPKGMPPPANFPWPSKAMRRWTTKVPQSLLAWKSKYSKTNAWKKMLKKWMNGR